MQRWLFFTFCFFGAGLLGAQEIDIHTTSVSYWLAGSQSIDSGIAAQADIRFKSKSATDSLLFYPSYLVIHSVRKKEGRLKQYYGFRQMGDSLWIYSLALEPGQVATLHFDYEIPIASPLYQHMVYRDSTVLGFNFFNTDAGVSAGQVGSFYPGIFGDDTRLEMNITTRSGKAVSGPGLPEFKVENGDGTISHFWSSRVSYTPADFYLVVGDFEESDPTKIAGDLPQVSLNVEKLKAQQNQQKLANLMAFTGHPESMTEARMAELQQVSRQPLPGFYLSPADAGQSKDQLQLEKAYLLATSDNDTNQASEKLLAYYQHERGSPWRESLIEDKWRHFANLSKSARQSTLHLKLQAWQDATPWLSELSQVRLDTGLRDRLRHHLKPPSLTMSYRYVASDTAVYVSYVQDTNRAPAYQVPLKLNLVTREDSNFFFSMAARARGPSENIFTTGSGIRSCRFWATLSG
ncbi:MAG: hypothetical protein U5L96_16120 [Owenweeksia sp.]|nr:hypothetical protein [Owenweeksia sp.]